ncbi:Hypothetical predicted protein, partial [Pelobates cultripes]
EERHLTNSQRIAVQRHQIPLGFPAKMLLTKDGSTQVITSPEDGIRKLRLWGLTEKELEPQASPPRHLQLEWSRATPTKKTH